jgi:hypothetical protein
VGPIHSSAPNRHEAGSAGLPQPEEAGRIPASYDASQTISQTAGPFTHPVTSFFGLRWCRERLVSATPSWYNKQ